MLPYLNAISIFTYSNIGALQKIHDHFEGDWQAAWHSDLNKITRFDESFSAFKKKTDPEREFERLHRENIDMVTKYDNNYPALLQHIADPPFLLYVRGSQSVWQNICFGVVGTRRVSEYGRRATPHIVQELTRSGLTIVSGLAAGIDTLAHKAAVAERKPTIAVLGCGVDDASIFPPQNVGLAKEILTHGGTIMSEYAPGAPGMKHTFPQRNRIISGLSKGVLVIEADIKSGSLITANCALEQNRDVFAVPGSIFSQVSQGTNSLLKKGAKLVTCATDILEEYSQVAPQQLRLAIEPASPEEAKILSAVSQDPISLNDLIRITGLSASEINATLVMMELEKKIKNLGNHTFVSII